MFTSQQQFEMREKQKPEDQIIFQIFNLINENSNKNGNISITELNSVLKRVVSYLN
jgi:hypothetical protein